MNGVCSKVPVVLLIFTVSTSYASDFDNVSDLFCLSCRSRKHSNVDEGMKMGKLTPDIAKTGDNNHDLIQDEDKNNIIKSMMDTPLPDPNSLFGLSLDQSQEFNIFQGDIDLNSLPNPNILQNCSSLDVNLDVNKVKTEFPVENFSDVKTKNLENGNLFGGKGETNKLLNKKRGRKPKKNDNLLGVKRETSKLLFNKRRRKLKINKNLSSSKIETLEDGVLHDRCYSDNCILKLKVHVLELVLNFINTKIKKVYHLKDKSTEVLQKIGAEYYNNNRDDKEFIAKSLKEIFSFDLSTKFKRLDKTHNKKLIEKLIDNEKDNEEKIFTELFNLSFIDCVNYFTGVKSNALLDGMKKMDECKEEISRYAKDEEEKEKYLKHFCTIAKEFEGIVNTIVRRPNRHGKEENTQAIL